MPNKKKPVQKKPIAKKQQKPKAAKKTQLSEYQKQQLAHTRMRLKEATQEIRIDNKIVKEIEDKGISHPDLLSSPIIKTGVTNKFSTKETKYLKEVKKLKKMIRGTVEHKKQKQNVSNAKKELRTEEVIINREVKEIAKLNKYSKGPVSLHNDEGDIITVRGVNKYYSQKHMIFKALDDASLSIKRGTFNVILGPSGSGKTTLLNMISGLDRNTYGEIIVSGTNIAALSTKELTQFRRKYIGFVFQSYNLLSSLNVSDNIEVGRSLQQDPTKRINIRDLLEDMDMGANEKKKTYELSGGQQQRVSIARALAKTPDILIGDEPTGALDQVTSLKVFELFQEINEKQNSTVIIVTHNVNVAKLAHQVIHVKNGKIDKIVVNDNPLKAKDLKEI